MSVLLGFDSSSLRLQKRYILPFSEKYVIFKISLNNGKPSQINCLENLRKVASKTCQFARNL
jgi:hypothetical protein